MRVSPTERPAVVARDLVKRLGKRNVVNRLSFTVAPGEMFALLGKNGAGKSTTMKMLSTLMRPTAGRALVAGHDVAAEPREVRRRIGLVFQEPTLDRQLSVEQNLRCHAVLYGMSRRQAAERVEYSLNLVGLTKHRKVAVSALSGGLSRRLEIVRALMHKPRILFLDEPSLGLDPPTRTRLWKEIRALRDLDGLTVLMTTHYMDEVEHMDRLAIVNAGELVAVDSPTRLKAAVGLDRIRLRTADNRLALGRLRAVDVSAWPEEDTVVCYVPDAERSVGRILDLVNLPVTLVDVQRPSLDDVFLHFTEKALAAQLDEPAPTRAGAAGRYR